MPLDFLSDLKYSIQNVINLTCSKNKAGEIRVLAQKCSEGCEVGDAEPLSTADLGSVPHAGPWEAEGGNKLYSIGGVGNKEGCLINTALFRVRSLSFGKRGLGDRWKP